MYDSLFLYIETKSSMLLNEGDRILLQSKFKPKKLRKRQYFLQEGDVCKYMGFIVKGSTRMFTVDEKGHEHILRFGLESWWVGDYESFHLLTPSRYHIEALEDTELLLVTYEQIQEMITSIPALDATIRAMDKQNVIANAKRMHAAISLTAEERYEELAKAYPIFLQRFPQNMIASYLGISPETLSRIRKNALKYGSDY